MAGAFTIPEKEEKKGGTAAANVPERELTETECLEEAYRLIQPKADFMGRLPVSLCGEDIGYWPKDIQKAVQDGRLDADMVKTITEHTRGLIEKAVDRVKPKQEKAWKKWRDKFISLLKGQFKADDKDESLPEWENPSHLHISGSHAVNYSDTAQKLFNRLAKEHRFFVRGKDMVIVSKTGELEVISDNALRSIPDEFFEKVLCVNTRKGLGGSIDLATKKSNLSRDLCAALLASEWLTLLPEIHTISACPVVYESSEGQPAIHRNGYLDHANGIFVAGGASEEISLTEAVGIIESVLDDFLFPTPADRARAIAMILTPALVQGGFIADYIPGDFAEANDSQAGKGYRHNLIVAIYNDSAALVTQRFGGTGSLDEFFGNALLSGRTFIRLDNLRGKLDSPSIESFFTTPYGSDFLARGFRQAGQVRAGRNILPVSSNGLEGTRDISNRMCVVRIRKQPADYVFKTFPEGDRLEHIKANQGRFLGAVHSVIAEWIRQGKPRSTEHRHDFRKWAQILDWILTNLFKRPGMLDGHREIQTRVSTPLVAALRELAIVLDRASRLGEDLVASELVDIAEEHNVTLPDCRFKDHGQQAQQLGRKFGALFRESGKSLSEGADSIIIEEYELVRMIEQIKRDDGKGIHDQKTYRFRKVPG